MWDAIYQTVLENMGNGVLPAVGVAVFRNLTGWIQNSFKDGKVQEYELKQLGATFVKYFAGITLLSFGMPLEASVATVFGIDLVGSKLKEITKK